MDRVSDIPVGSPPVPSGRHAAPSGWYRDPSDPNRERYWDGWQWSRNTRAAERLLGPPPGGPTGGAGYPYGQPSSGGSYPDPFAPGQSPAPYYATARLAGVAVTADGIPLASWWSRVLAVLIDSLIVAAIATIPSVGIYARLFRSVATIFSETMRAAQSGLPAPPTPTSADLISVSDQLTLTVITLVVGLAYHLAFVRWKAATPGKLICRLRIVPVDQGRNRAPLSWNTVIVRVAIWVLPGIYSLLLFFKLLDALFPLWQPNRQALHDLAARTQVVKLG
jgi:uncharacterized RDD family membrane protein YckC